MILSCTSCGNLTHSSFASVGFLICHQKPQSSCNFSLGIHNYRVCECVCVRTEQILAS